MIHTNGQCCAKDVTSKSLAENDMNVQKYHNKQFQKAEMELFFDVLYNITTKNRDKINMRGVIWHMGGSLYDTWEVAYMAHGR